MLANNLLNLDRDHLVHPVISWTAHERRGPTILSHGKGCHVTDIEGRELLDGFAGLWCVNVGYGQDSVVKAAAEQMAKLPYATGYFHFASEPTIRLAARVAELAPGDLNHVFFTLGGSDAVDTAIRLIRFYWNVSGKPAKRHLISLERGYHGSSSVGAGVTALAAFHANFSLPLPEQHHIPSHYAYRNPAGPDEAAIIAASVAQLEAKVAELGAETVAAFFAEPVQGSGGVIVPPRGWLKAMREACRRLDILFVADEVITGFGRTGPMFACESEDVVPDILTVAKGLTAGYAPMGATLLSEGVYRTIADGADPGAIVGHGYTYSGHPVSAAVGLEVLRLYTEGGILDNARRVAPYFESRLRELESHPLVGDVRSRGLLAGIELVADKESKAKHPAELGLPARLAETGYSNSLIFRAFPDNAIGLAPALCITETEVDHLIERLRRTLDTVLDSKDVANASR